MKTQAAVCVFVLTLAGGIAWAQDEEAARRAQAQDAARLAEAITPLKIDVTISRIEATSRKTISRLAYTLMVNANEDDWSTLNMGAQVPVRMTMTPSVDGKPVQGLVEAGPVQYRQVGTSINARASTLDAGRFSLEVRIEDTSVYEGGQGEPRNPVFRTFTATNRLVLRDGQSIQFTAAADRVSGEVVQAEVTLTVLK